MKLEVDLGLRTRHVAWFRLAHVNTPELKDQGGAAARDRLSQLMDEAAAHEPVEEFPLIIKTTRDRTEKFGRWLCTIGLPDARDVGQVLVQEGHARKYEGGRR